MVEQYDAIENKNVEKYDAIENQNVEQYDAIENQNVEEWWSDGVLFPKHMFIFIIKDMYVPAFTLTFKLEY